jgi:hypothetical protein
LLPHAHVFKENSMWLPQTHTDSFEPVGAVGQVVNAASVAQQVRAMDFGAIPPEINSGRLRTGPGCQPMLAAAGGWEALAAGLREIAMTCHSASLMPGRAAQAVAPYVGWLNSVAAQAEQTAAQAKAAALAYLSALAATVPPPRIAASRLARAALAATNHLGQFSPLIADADADYERMWAADAHAMYAYAGASAAAATVTPFAPPPDTADPSGQEILSTGSRLISILPQALQTLSSSPFTPFEGTLSSAMSSLLEMSSLSVPANYSMSPAEFASKKMRLAKATIGSGARALGTGMAPLGALPAAGFGQGMPIGVLSVPPAWAPVD